jgi:hypothetical protein
MDGAQQQLCFRSRLCSRGCRGRCGPRPPSGSAGDVVCRFERPTTQDSGAVPPVGVDKPRDAGALAIAGACAGLGKGQCKAATSTRSWRESWVVGRMPDSPASRLLRALRPPFPDKLAGGELLSELSRLRDGSSRRLTFRRTAFLFFPFLERQNAGAIFELRMDSYADPHADQCRQRAFCFQFRSN